MAWAIDKNASIEMYSNQENQISQQLFAGNANSKSCGISDCCFKILATVSFVVSLISIGCVIYMYNYLISHPQNTHVFKPPVILPLIGNHNYTTTAYPTNGPTLNPTGSTDSPTIKRTTAYPTNSPTLNPSDSPTIELTTVYPINTSTSAYKYASYSYVGDYKISIQNTSHGNWLLCNGSFLDPRDYTELFDIIGYTFGKQRSQTEYIQSGDVYQLLTRFALPDVKDRVIGINGDKYSTGDTVGRSMMNLDVAHMPAHSHTVVVSSVSTSSSVKKGYVSHSSVGTHTTYKTESSDKTKNTNSVGTGSSFDLYQPTIFMGNLFIYAGGQ